MKNKYIYELCTKNIQKCVIYPVDSCSYDYLEIIESVAGSNSSGFASRKLCGDWSSKLKLLRYVSRGPQLRLRFVSDYSHHYGGFKAKVAMERGEETSAWICTGMMCRDGRLGSKGHFICSTITVS